VEIAFSLQGMEFAGLLGDHGQDTCVGVISVGSPNAAAQPAVEALKAADRPQVFAIPRRVNMIPASPPGTKMVSVSRILEARSWVW